MPLLNEQRGDLHHHQVQVVQDQVKAQRMERKTNNRVLVVQTIKDQRVKIAQIKAVNNQRKRRISLIAQRVQVNQEIKVVALENLSQAQIKEAHLMMIAQRKRDQIVQKRRAK